MPKFNWGAAKQAVEASIEDLIKVKKEVYKMQFGFWEKLEGCADQQKRLLRNLNELETLTKTISKYVEFNSHHFAQDLQIHIYTKKVGFFNNLFGTIQFFLCYIFAAVGLVYAVAASFGLITAISTTAKIATGLIAGGVILLTSIVTTVSDAKAKKNQLEKATMKAKNTILKLKAAIKQEEETSDSD